MKMPSQRSRRGFLAGMSGLAFQVELIDIPIERTMVGGRWMFES